MFRPLRGATRAKLRGFSQVAPLSAAGPNRNGLVVDATLTHATGTAEREAALTMLDRRPRRRRITPGAEGL